MDYFQGVVTEYLRAKRSVFINTEFLISLDEGKLKKGRHWYCDALAVDMKDRCVSLCEITYSANPHALVSRLIAWRSCWREIGDAIRRDSGVPEDWSLQPWVFLPKRYEDVFQSKFPGFSELSSDETQMPNPLITHLESILPWEYLLTWDRKVDHFAMKETKTKVSHQQVIPI